MEQYFNSKFYKDEFNEIVNKFAVEGVDIEQANIVAHCLATADIFGVKSHGIAVLPSHITRIKNGSYNLNPKFKVIRETSAFALIDGDNAMGPVSAKYCLDYGIEKCKNSGVFSVFSRNNNTFGPAFYYSLKAAEQGYMAFMCSNSPAQMAPFGGKEKLFGTNPFSIVIPIPNQNPIIIDMATSVVAKSKFNEYKSEGKKIPLGWALDIDGNPTTDPEQAIKGLVQPMAGFKGYAISMLIDIVSGVLSGAAYLNNVGRFYSEDSMNVGFYISVIDPKQILGESYDSIIEDYICTIRNAETQENRIIAIPGDDRNKYKDEICGNE